MTYEQCGFVHPQTRGYEKRIDEEPTFLRIDNGWYVFDDNGDTVMIPPSMSQMIREVTVVEYHSLSQEWADRCRNINPVLRPPTPMSPDPIELYPDHGS